MAQAIPHRPGAHDQDFQVMIEVTIERNFDNSVVTPNVHDSSIASISLVEKGCFEIEFERIDGSKFLFRVDEIIEFGIREYVRGAGVNEIFIATFQDLDNQYIPEDEHPWGLANPSMMSKDELESAKTRLISYEDNIVMMWIDCNFSGFISIVGKRVSSFKIA